MPLIDQHLSRRSMLAGLASILAAIGAPNSFAVDRAAGGTAFSRKRVIEQARQLAAETFRPANKVPQALRRLNYDLYRQIRFRKDKAIWGRSPTKFSTELFAPGFLYETGVDINVVESGLSHAVGIDTDSFETPSAEVAAALARIGQFAGFRLHHPINREDYRDEFIVFQGASYFRAVSKGQNYGLSVRGLAIDVAEPTGEEFPIFRRFWIERPSSRESSIVVHALLDSPRVAGAYRFGIYPGAPTTVDVDAVLFARETLNHIGLGALTSMYMHGSADTPDSPDYRPAVHDSLGLAMHTGRGEHLWRPLTNPATLQVSAFVDKNPIGFGLIQRSRRFEHFQDLEAVYEKRPSAWVAPRGDWGPGHVQLVEIPSDSETNDNIVVYWRPQNAIEPGHSFDFSFRLTWPNDNPLPREIARVDRSAYGLNFADKQHQMAIDYAGIGVLDTDTLSFDVSLSTGKLVEQLVQPNRAAKGARIFLTFEPDEAKLIEFRVQPQRMGVPVGETWLYRWARA